MAFLKQGDTIREETDSETIAQLYNAGWALWEPLPPDYLAFWDAVLISSTYATLLDAAMTSLPVNTALTAFIAAFQDAKEGRPNPGAIQACIFLVMGAAVQGLTAEHLAELQGLMDAHHLAEVYSLTP
jgi:hypothetical protein